MITCKLIFTENIKDALFDLYNQLDNPHTVIITEKTVEKKCLPILHLPIEWQRIVLPAGEECKTISAISEVWHRLYELNTTRNSLIINIGGGALTDAAGFAAATYKRGVRFVNIPTTLLASIDASFGGKTGINFDGLKNQVGVFAEPIATIISPGFYKTLPDSEILSGYGELLKHSLLCSTESTLQAIRQNPLEIDSESWLSLVKDSIDVKINVVEKDPYETGLRKVLNLGHTAGHAFERIAANKGTKISHGQAIAHGLIVSLVLSNLELGFSSEILHKVASFVRTFYHFGIVTCDDYPSIIKLMMHDKKNTEQSKINFTLLKAPGKAVWNHSVNQQNIETALDIYRDLLGLA